MEEARLAGAVGADDGAKLPRLHREVHVGDGAEGAEVTAERAGLEDGRHHPLPVEAVGRLRPSTQPLTAPTTPPGRKMTIRTKMAPVKSIHCSV